MRVIFLQGPTASGKTDLAVEIVRHFPCEIVSVDSAMVYRGMDIGTAKPGPELRRLAPHRLIDVCDPAESYSAARFRTDALAAIAEVRAAGRIPLLVGGTMLYFRALERGLSALPPANAAIRLRLEQEAAERGWPHLHARLAAADPASAARIHPNDPQRIQRALEVIELAGRRLSELLGPPPEPPPFDAVKLHVFPEDRNELHNRIESRFRRMMDEGLLGEVEALHSREDLHAGMPALRSVGYRQLWQYLEGGVDLDTAIANAIVATRQLARRQLTWLRSETGARRFVGEGPGLTDKILKYIGAATNY